MSSNKISVCIQGFAPEEQASLTNLLEASQRAGLKNVVKRYCETEHDYPTQEILKAQPEIILIDMHDEPGAVKSLSILRLLLPAAWLIACSESNDQRLITEAMRLGSRGYLLKPFSASSLETALDRYVDARQRIERRSQLQGKIYTVTSAKGGSGATSVAVNLAVTMADTEQPRVSLLDMQNLAGDVASYMGVESRFSFSDALLGIPHLDPVALDSYMTRAHGLFILSGSQNRSGLKPLTSGILAKMLYVASQAFSHTFIDMPSALDSDLLQIAARKSEAVLVVLTPELPSLWGAYKLIEKLRSLGFDNRIRLILNRADSRSDIINSEIQKFLNRPIYYRLPNDYKRSIQAAQKGTPLVLMNRSKLASAYRKLTQTLAGTDGAKPQGGLGKFISEALGSRPYDLRRDSPNTSGIEE
jgi:pilus assembly protein CpaE